MAGKQSDTYPPQVRLGRLYEKTSRATGNVYLSGRIGLAEIVVVKSRDLADDDTAIWDILVSQAPDRRKEPGERVEDARQPHKLGRLDEDNDWDLKKR